MTYNPEPLVLSPAGQRSIFRIFRRVHRAAARNSRPLVDWGYTPRIALFLMPKSFRVSDLHPNRIRRGAYYLKAGPPLMMTFGIILRQLLRQAPRTTGKYLVATLGELGGGFYTAPTERAALYLFDNMTATAMAPDGGFSWAAFKEHCRPLERFDTKEKSHD